MTPEERAQLDALTKRAADEDSEDDELEISVKTESGHHVILKGARARAFLRKHGLDDDDETGSSGDAGDDDDDDQAPADADTMFRRRGRKKDA